VRYTDDGDSPIKIAEAVADNPEQASELITRFELRRPESRRIRAVNIRSVEVIDKPPKKTD
jgi:hypothetical protein